MKEKKQSKRTALTVMSSPKKLLVCNNTLQKEESSLLLVLLILLLLLRARFSSCPVARPAALWKASAKTLSPRHEWLHHAFIWPSQHLGSSWNSPTQETVGNPLRATACVPQHPRWLSKISARATSSFPNGCFWTPHEVFLVGLSESNRAC